MNTLTPATATLLTLLTLPAVAMAEERMLAGTERGEPLIATGASDALSAPATVVRQMVHDGRGLGPLGLVTGAVRGGVRAAGQALQGGARMTIGILDTLTDPLHDGQ